MSNRWSQSNGGIGRDDDVIRAVMRIDGRDPGRDMNRWAESSDGIGRDDDVAP